MNAERMRCIISGIKRFKLTQAEAGFISCAEQSLNQAEPVSERAGLILEAIYGEKTEFIRHSVMSMLKHDMPSPPVRRAAPHRLHL